MNVYFSQTISMVHEVPKKYLQMYKCKRTLVVFTVDACYEQIADSKEK